MVIDVRNDVARGHSCTDRTVTVPRGASIRHHESHSGLVRRPSLTRYTAEKPPTLDAIIVPAARAAHNLETAITLARAVCCELIILCSRDALPADILDLLA